MRGIGVVADNWADCVECAEQLDAQWFFPGTGKIRESAVQCCEAGTTS
jgi:hypothetical protein